MTELINTILQNLENVAIGISIFSVAFASNMLFSTYYNTAYIGDSFDWKKLLNGIYKMLVFGVGTALLCVVVTTLPAFASHVGFVLPEEYVTIFDNVVIISAFLLTACKYVAEAFSKMKKILDGKVVSDEVSIQQL